MRPFHHPPICCFFSRYLVQTVRDPSELPWHCNMPFFNCEPRLTLSSACCSLQFVTTMRHAKHSHCRLEVQTTGIGFGSATVTFCMYSIAAFHFVIFTLTRLCCKYVSNVSSDAYRGICCMYPGIHTGEFPTVGVHTIYMCSGAFDVNSFWDTSTCGCFKLCNVKHGNYV